MVRPARMPLGEGTELLRAGGGGMDAYNIDSHKVMYHPERVAAWQASRGTWTTAKSIYPIYIEISPVGACNHRCTFCAVDYLGYEANSLNADVFQERFAEMGACGVKSLMLAGEGEPLIHKRTGDLVSTARSAGLDLALTTNGVLMGEAFSERLLESFSWVKVSCNAGTPEGYARIHRTRERDFETVMNNVSRAVERKRREGLEVTVGLQLVLLPENEDEVELLARRCRDELRPDYLVVKPYSQHRFSHTRTYEGIVYDHYRQLEERLAAYNDDEFKVIFRTNTIRKLADGRSYEKCSATPFFWAYVMATGDLYSCSAFLGDERFKLGNLHDSSFREIWEGAARQRCFDLVENRLDISTCRVNCRMDEVNRFLWELCNPPSHVNFI